MTNGKFAVSIHIMTLLAAAGDEWVSSEYLAGSININPVLVRKELINLRKHGLVKSREGKAGGSRLSKSSDAILLSDIYEAVKQMEVLGKGKNRPNPDCQIGRNINKNLDNLYQETERALIDSLRKTSLADFYKKFT